MRMKIYALNLSLVALEFVQQFPSCQIPQLSIVKNTIISEKCSYITDFCFFLWNIRCQKKNYLYGIIFTTRNNPSTVWSKPNCIYPSGMAFICVNATFSSYIPYFQISIQRTRCEEFTKWVEINWYTVRPMTG